MNPDLLEKLYEGSVRHRSVRGRLPEESAGSCCPQHPGLSLEQMVACPRIYMITTVPMTHLQKL
jgi:hypothetical protein